MYEVKIERTKDNSIRVKFLFNTHESEAVEAGIRHLTDGRCIRGRVERDIHKIMSIAGAGNIEEAERKYSKLLSGWIEYEKRLREPKVVVPNTKKIILIPA